MTKHDALTFCATSPIIRAIDPAVLAILSFEYLQTQRKKLNIVNVFIMNRPARGGIGMMVVFVCKQILALLSELKESTGSIGMKPNKMVNVRR